MEGTVNTSDFKVLVTGPDVPKVALELLKERGLEVIVSKDGSKDAILERISGVHALFWATHIPLDKEILDAAGRQLNTVATMSAGYDHIDTREIKNRCIRFGNTPLVLEDSVADMAILLALAASRRLHEGRLAMESGSWKNGNQWMLGRSIQDATIGILGFGKIGQTIAKRLRTFNVAHIYYTHREVKEAEDLKATFVPFEQLITRSDFIFAALPLNNKTANMFNDDLFSKMKNTTVFINVGRGGLVDQPALIRALKEGKIFAAGLDVMTPEPLPTDSELLKIPNLVLSPHLGSATITTRDKMAALAARNIVLSLGEECMVSPVEL